MEQLIPLSSPPLVLAILAGLAALFLSFSWLGTLRDKRKLHHDNQTLKNHLATDMEVHAQGDALLKSKLHEAERRCLNPKKMNSRLRDRPDRRQIILLETYERALRLMLQWSPGFAGPWHRALQEAGQEIAETVEGPRVFKRLVTWCAGKFRGPAPTEMNGVGVCAPGGVSEATF